MPPSPVRPASIFYCFSDHDAALKHELATRLEVLRQQGTVVTWGHDQILGGQPAAEELRAHLDTADLILLLLSPDLLADERFHRDVLPRALQRAEAQQARVVPVLVRLCDWRLLPGLAALEVLPRSERAVNLDERHDVAWHEIFRELRAIIDQILPPPSPERPSLVPGLKLARSLRRGDVLVMIHEAFLQAAPPRLVCLHGTPGSGKNCAAIEFARSYRDHYQGVFMIFARDEQSLQDGLADIATRALRLPLKDPERRAEAVAAARRWLDDHRGWLLVLCEASDPALLARYLPTGDGDVLITSHDDMQAMQPPPDRSIRLRDLLPEEALAFFRERTQRPLDGKELEAAQDLALRLGLLPYALCQAAAFIQCEKLSFTAYRDHLRHCPTDLLDRLPELRAVVNLALDRITRADSIALMSISAVLDGARIPLELFTPEGLQALGPPLGAIGDEYELHRALAPLCCYGLIYLDPISRTYEMNRLVQLTVRARATQQDERRWAEHAVALVGAAMRQLPILDWHLHRVLAPQVRAAAQLVTEWKIHNAATMQMLNKVGSFLIGQAEYERAAGCYGHALSICDDLPAAQPLDRADLYNGLGRIAYHQGRYREAEEHLTRALRLRLEAAGPTDPVTATSQNNLALLRYHMDPTRPGIEEAYREALAVREARLERDHPYVGKTLNNLGLYLAFHGRLDEAEGLHRRALELRRRVLNPGHPDLGQSLSGLARVARQRGRHGEAEEGYRQARAIAEAALGPGHPSVGYSVIGLARAHCLAGRLEDARRGYEEALSLWEASLGPQHPMVGWCHFGLGLVHGERGQPERAQERFRCALRCWEDRLAQQHPEVQAARRGAEGPGAAYAGCTTH